MPEFVLNTPPKAQHPFYAMDTFARAYVEAVFFTNGDTGDDRENLLNDWGVECLTPESCAQIRLDCAAFKAAASDTLAQAIDIYGEEKAAHDFWFTRQGHGAGYWDGDLPDDIGTILTAAAKAQGECCVEAYRRKIHVR